MTAKQIKKKNKNSYTTARQSLSYNHETSPTVVNKLITIMYKYFISFQIFHSCTNFFHVVLLCVS